MLHIPVDQIPDEGSVLVTPAVMLFMRNNGEVFYLDWSDEKGPVWIEVSPIPHSDRQVELEYLEPHKDDE